MSLIWRYLIRFAEQLNCSCYASTAKFMLSLSHTLVPTSGSVSPKTSGTLLLSLPSKANSRYFSSQNISVKPHCPSLLSVCTVCVCKHVHLLHNYAWTLVDIYIFIFLDNIFHLDVHYVCMLVQRFEPQGRRFTNFHYYYYLRRPPVDCYTAAELWKTTKDNIPINPFPAAACKISGLKCAHTRTVYFPMV